MKKSLFSKPRWQYLLLVLMSIVWTTSAYAGHESWNMVLTQKDGFNVVFSLTNKPLVTFSESVLIISTEHSDISYYELDEVQKITYEKVNPTALNNVKADESSFKLNGESIVFNTLKANSTIAVFTVGGEMLFNKTFEEAGEYVFPISELSTGVYLIYVNGSTFKIAKK